MKTLKLITKILTLIILLFALPFYFGYGNPLPFINSEYTLWDNVWLTVFPLIFAGLIIGLKYEKIGGYIITAPIFLGMLISLIFVRDFDFGIMLVPFVFGVMYLIIGYKKV